MKRDLKTKRINKKKKKKQRLTEKHCDVTSVREVRESAPILTGFTCSNYKGRREERKGQTTG